jgi:hypothetical protein
VKDTPFVAKLPSIRYNDVTIIQQKGIEMDNWLNDRITYLKGLKSRTEQQELLVLLAEKPQKTSLEERKLTALIRAEKAALRASKARQEVAKLLNAEKKAAKAEERKARNHRLILQGILFDLSGLEHRSRGELLGMLLSAVGSDETRWGAWKVKGDALLAEKENTANG